MNYNIITTSQQLRDLTGSWYANADFSKIQTLVRAVEDETAQVIGSDTMEWIARNQVRTKLKSSDADLRAEALAACSRAVALMAVMRYQRLNDISHEDQGRKVKIDRDNEARPFEWQLARDDRMHLEEYYRALDRLLFVLQDVPEFQRSAAYRQTQHLIIGDAGLLAELTGVDPSPWLFLRMVPFLNESQHHTARAYGDGFDTIATTRYTDLLHAARKSVALGALALMGSRTALQSMPYGLMKTIVADGGGNNDEPPTQQQLYAHLKTLYADTRYWTSEMQRLRDLYAGSETYTHLHTPDNDPRQKFMRL